jgi:AcrR family transcriptional regulator
MNTQVKKTIKETALKYFCSKGFYGTSIRDIAHEVGCSLPTVYYYFKNKEQLFEELAYHDFLELTERLRGEISVKEDIKEMYTQSLLQRLHLKGNDRLTYVLALKTILGMDHNLTVTDKLHQWEQSRYHYAHILLKDHFGISNSVYGNILSRVSSNMIQKALIYEQQFSDDLVRDEINTLFRMMKEDNK